MTRTRDELLDALCEAALDWRDDWDGRVVATKLPRTIRSRLAAVLDEAEVVNEELAALRELERLLRDDTEDECEPTRLSPATWEALQRLTRIRMLDEEVSEREG